MNQMWNVIKLVMFGAVTTMALVACGSDATAPAAPAAPATVTANAGTSQATINWAPVAGATSYNIYRGTAAGVTKTNGTKVAGAVSPQAVTGLTNGTTYFFVVTAVNAAGESAVSAEKSATPSVTPPPAAPVTVRGAAGVSKATISWDASAGATSYNIYYSTTSGVTKTSGTKVTGAVSPQDVTGLTNGTTYFFVVTAMNANGESASSFEVSATPAATPPPTAPSGVTATAGNGLVSVSWTALAGATSYNIYYAASTGVTKATGTKVAGAVSPRAVIGLTNGTTYFFVVTSVSANGESVESSQGSATPVAPQSANFTQADLTGTWNFMQFVSGPEVTAGTHYGWLRGNATIDASGNVTVNSIISSDNSVTGPPPVGTITQTIDANGVVTEGGVNGAGTGNHAVMSANKQLVVGIQDSGNNNRAFRIFIKQVGTFSNADISSGTFMYSQLKTGAGNSGWQFGTGTINAAQQVTLTSILDSNGPTTLPPPNNVTLAITAAGIVTNTGTNAEPTFQGVMTPDKELIIGTETNTGGGYKLRIITLGGMSFSTADLAGTWKFNQLYTSSIWEYGTMSFTSAGVGTPLSFLDSNGSTTLGTGPTLSVGPTGLITKPGKPSTNGVMAFNKNIFVATDTNATGVFSMSIVLK